MPALLQCRAVTGEHKIALFRDRFPFSEPIGVILGGNIYIVYYYRNFCQIKKFAFKTFLV